MKTSPDKPSIPQFLLHELLFASQKLPATNCTRKQAL
jgi:hypothetical protein